MEKQTVPDAEFLKELRNRYTSQRIDRYIHEMPGKEEMCTTENLRIADSDDFILFLLGTIRAQEKDADYTVTFANDYCSVNGSTLPMVVFRRKSCLKKNMPN